MAVTIRDVAKRLNLSITTISRALDGYDDVAEGTRQRVIETAQEMGYVPNRAARQLRKQRTETIGYILPTSTPRFSDPFFLEFMSGLGDEVAKQNYDLLISSALPGETAERMIYQRWVHGHRVDGFVLNRMRLHDWRVQYLKDKNIPFVTFERSLDAADYPSIEVSGKAEIKSLIVHLLEQGHKRMAFISASPALAIQEDRFSGFREGLHEAGLTLYPELVVEGDLTRHGGFKAAQKLLSLSDPPTAVICINDLTAIGALQAASSMGLQVGRELAIAGFDGIEITENIQATLTTIKQPVYDIARDLVKLLLAEINGVPLLQRRIQMQPELILRASTG
jgi:LacI family transcriptional regulator, galactose operon repressor